MDEKNIADNLRLLRIISRLNQFNLARMIGCTQHAISNWEKGARKPNSQYLIRLSKVFQVPITALLIDPDELAKYIRKNTVQTRFSQEIKILKDADLKDYELRKKVSCVIHIPPHQNASSVKNKKEIIHHNIVSYRPNPNVDDFINIRKSVPNPNGNTNSNDLINIEIDAPYSNGDVVVFDDIKSEKVVIAKFKIIKGKYFLSPSDAAQPMIPLWSEGKRYCYIGKVIADLAVPPRK